MSLEHLGGISSSKWVLGISLRPDAESLTVYLDPGTTIPSRELFQKGTRHILGAGWLKPSQKALQWFRWEPDRRRLDDEALYMSLLSGVRKEVEAGVAYPSTASRGIQRQEEFGLNEIELAYGVSSPWGGGVGTVSVGHEFVDP